MSNAGWNILMRSFFPSIFSSWNHLLYIFLIKPIFAQDTSRKIIVLIAGCNMLTRPFWPSVLSSWKFSSFLFLVHMSWGYKLYQTNICTTELHRNHQNLTGYFKGKERSLMQGHWIKTNKIWQQKIVSRVTGHRWVSVIM